MSVRHSLLILGIICAKDNKAWVNTGRWKFDLVILKNLIFSTFTKSFMKKLFLWQILNILVWCYYLTKYYHVGIFSIMAAIWIWILHGSLFFLLNVFSGVFYCYRDIKMSHSSFEAIWKTFLCSSIPCFISNVLASIFACSFISESELHSFLFPKSERHSFTELNFIHLCLWHEIFPHCWA